MTDRRTVRELLALLPPQGSRHMLAIDLARYTRPAWHGWVNNDRNEPHQAAPTALRHLALLLRGRQPHFVVLAGEGKDLHRSKLHAGYKAGRPPKPIGLTESEHAVRMACVRAGVAPYCVAGLEADDVLHAAVIVGGMGDMPVVVVTEDKDADQLCSNGLPVLVWDGEERVKDDLAVQALWGVPAARLPELFALAGDRGDGIPGVDGWGPKTAMQIINALGTRKLELAMKDGGQWWVPPKWRDKFIANRDVIRLSYELGRLRGKWLADRPQFEATQIDSLQVAQCLTDEAERLLRS
jgi:5'-3' exonuclease